MAAQKSKKKSTKKVNIDEKYNFLIRMNALGMLEHSITLHHNNYSEADTTTVINHIKDAYLPGLKHMFDYNIDESYYILTLECVHDLLGLTYNNVTFLKGSLGKIKDIMVERLKTDNIKHELLISTSQLGVLFENIYNDSLLEEYIDIRMKPLSGDNIAKSITDIQYFLVVYLMTYIDKCKNKEYDRYELGEDNHTYLFYKSTPMLSLDDINHCIKRCSILLEKDNRYVRCIQKFSKQQHEVYSKFVTKDMESDYINTASFDSYLFGGAYTRFPLLDEMLSPVVSIENLNKIPNERLYAAPKAGIRFEFVNKDKHIDYIDMKENKEYIFFNVHIISKGDVYYGSSLLDDKKLIDKNNIIKEDETFKISFIFGKKMLSENKDYYSKLVAYGTSSNCVNNPQFDLTKKALYGVLMTCIYMAYYDPNLFRGEVRMYNRKGDKATGYTREDYYRVAHLRKLPENSTCSKEAKDNARKEGFDYIPDGYTFVRATTPLENIDKKVIKIKE